MGRRVRRPARRPRSFLTPVPSADYGLPAGTVIYYGAKGFPPWVYDLAKAFGLQASTYQGHQEGGRAEAGYDPNPRGLNRGIDWAGPVDAMQRFAEYLLTVRSVVEQAIWENPHTGQRVGIAGGDDVTHTPYFASDYSGHRDHVHTRQSRPIPIPGSAVPQQDSLRPKFTEVEAWIGNHSPRNGVNPDLFILHTQEGGDGDPQRLAEWMGRNGVSYHYTVSTCSPRVLVCDVIDTDLASWSVLSANPRSINLCFAGSHADWSRQEWLNNAADSIDVAAYLAVQDCRKYRIPVKVIAPPYSSGRAGITDHRYVTEVLRDGSHSDVGNEFPWDVFDAAVEKYSGATVPAPTRPTTPGGFLMALSDSEQRELLDLARQQSGIKRVSRSPLRHLGEKETQTVTGFDWSTDGSVHVMLVELLASLGHPPTLQLLNEISKADPVRFPDRQEDRKIAQAILNKLAMAGKTANPVVVQQVIERQPEPVYQSPELAVFEPRPSGDTDLYSEMADLRNQIHSLTQSLAELSSAFLGKK